MADIKIPGPQPVGSPLYLRDEELRQGVGLLFFASRAVAAEGANAVSGASLGPAHTRAIMIIARNPGLSVTDLQGYLKVAKQSLNRVLRTLFEDGLVEARVGKTDKRERRLHLTEKGAALERSLSDAQRARMRAAYRAAGPQSVQGFRMVLEAMMDPEMRRQYQGLKENNG